MELIDTTEMYLRTIYQLREEGVVPMRARIAEALGHSGPTVSQTIARMERDGLVRLAPDRRLVFTAAGELRAMRVMRKHRLAERLLVEIIGLEWAKAHDEACRWEHVMSEQVERRLITILQPPFISPYGLDIPGLEELGFDATNTGGLPKPVQSALTLAQGSSPGPARAVRMTAVGESVQAEPEEMDLLDRAGLRPPCRISVSLAAGGGLVEVKAQQGGGALNLTPALAQHVLVAPV